jgi:hypothetical protein
MPPSSSSSIIIMRLMRTQKISSIMRSVGTARATAREATVLLLLLLTWSCRANINTTTAMDHTCTAHSTWTLCWLLPAPLQLRLLKPCLQQQKAS